MYYSIMLTNGNTTIIKADNSEWNDKARIMTFTADDNRRVVARLNMDNIAGWIKSNDIIDNNQSSPK